MDYETKNTEKRLVSQNYPGVRMGSVFLLTEYNSIQIDCYDREEALILLFSFRSISTFPMESVHGLEYSPFRIVSQFFRNGRTIEAILQCRELDFSCKLIDYTINSQHCVSKPVAHHNSIVAESELIEPVNDYLCTSRHHVGFFACNHKCIGIKLNIEADGVSIILFPIQPTAVVMSKISFDDNVRILTSFVVKLVIAKCQSVCISGSFKSISKKSSNHEANHVSNHDESFVISVISLTYKGSFYGANHVSNHAANHDRAKMTSFCSCLTTQVTTTGVLVKCVISITYIGIYFASNHDSNHDRLKNGGSKMILTTKVTTMKCCVISDKSIRYRGVILSANHASNHERKQKSLLGKTYSSILYIIILKIIILYFYLQGRYAHAHTREMRF